MSRPRRTPAPPGRVHVVCTHRLDDAEPVLIGKFQMTADPKSPGGILISALGGPPVEGFAYAFRCSECRRHVKTRKERFVPLVLVLAEQQGTHGETPDIVDISRIERAL
jgi:hypothetical protein